MVTTPLLSFNALACTVMCVLAVLVVWTDTAARSDEFDETISSLQRQIDDLQRELRNRGSTNSANNSTTFHRNLQNVVTTTPPFTYAATFGAVGDAKADDTLALQAAIASAAASTSGGTVILGSGTYLTTEPLILPGGVSLQGQGYGSSPLAIKFDSGASTIAFCGTGYAIKMEGHASSINDLAIYDWPYDSPDPSKPKNYCATLLAAGAVLVEANGKLIESVKMSRVLLYSFTGGTALTLKGTNTSGIAYSSFVDIRIRHAKRGIHLVADATSFVNSNQFFAGAISGTIEEVAVRAQGPGACNDNKFYGMVIEPPVTNLTHVHVLGPNTNIRMHNVRLEGTGMVSFKRPLVVIEDDSYGNVMNGMLGHTHVQGDLLRNPEIDFVGAKTVGISPAPLNMFTNSAFRGFDATNSPYWSITGNNQTRNISKVEETFFAHHQVIHVDHLQSGEVVKFSPLNLPLSPGHSSCTFGIYARTSIPGAIVATMRYESGSMISSAEHSGSGKWEFIGMSALMSKTTGPQPIFFISGDVDITAPTFVYGSTTATPGASFLSASGAIMSGTLTMGITKAYPPAVGLNQLYWTLPSKDGNIFQMEMNGVPNRSIQRLNYLVQDRFPKGTVVSLLFAQVGTQVLSNPYIKLLGNANFTALKANSCLTLVSNGDSTWTEISRNA